MMSPDGHWFEMRLKDDAVRLMTRSAYYASQSWVRRVRHIMRLRYAAAYVDPANPDTVIIPSISDVLPEKFK
jgi:hypothetical protein